MNISKKVLIIGLSIVPTMAIADSAISEQEVRYQGDSRARRICKAVVDDDAPRLNRLLKDYKSTLIYSYSFDVNSGSIPRSFTCNGLALVPFSEEIAAHSVTSYLRNGSVSIEKVVASSMK